MFSALYITPACIYLQQLFTNSLQLPALYHIIDQSILAAQVGRERGLGRNTEQRIAAGGGQSVKMVPKIAQLG
jgi:hypothetical protein